MISGSRHFRVPIAVIALVLLVVSLWLMLGGCGASFETFAIKSAAAGGPVTPTANSPTLDSDDISLAFHVGSTWPSEVRPENDMRAVRFGANFPGTAFGPALVVTDGSRFTERLPWPSSGGAPIARRIEPFTWRPGIA